LSRQTPKGWAVNFEIVPVTLPDGSDGVITWKAALDLESYDKGKLFGLYQECRVQLYAVSDQQAFKIINADNWKSISQVTTPLSNSFASAKLPDEQTVTFPYRCAATEDQVRTLKAGAADLLYKSVSKDTIKLDETLRSLGFQGDWKAK
jgi:hypothetical protein